jgi:hypothetical protein
VKTLARIGVLAIIGAATGFAWWRVHHKPQAVVAKPVPPPVKRDWVAIDPNPVRLNADLPPDPNAGKPRFGECAVYVDGRPVAVLTYGELPPTLPVHLIKLEDDGGTVRRFLMAEYLDALGIDVRKIRQVHLYGGQSRIAILDGGELRRYARKFYFSFTRQTTGKPQMHSPGKDFKISDYVDTITTITVYIDKKPPRFSNEVQSLVDDDGREIDGVPYAKAEMRGGTRVYLDAHLVSNIKRNLLSSTMAVSQDEKGKPRYSLDAFLRAQKVELPKIHSIELVDADRVVLSVRPDQLSKPIEFETIQDSSGTELFHVSQTKGESQIEASVVRIYSRPHGALALR